MATVADAILAIRSAVQDFGDEHTNIGGPAHLDQVQWLGALLGWAWPRTYFDLLAKHDGVRLRHAHIPDFFSAFRSFVVHREPWHRLQYWPIADDGCGNYWVMALAQQRDGDCPIHFLDHETNTGLAAPDYIAARSLPDFVVDYMNQARTHARS